MRPMMLTAALTALPATITSLAQSPARHPNESLGSPRAELRARYAALDTCERIALADSILHAAARPDGSISGEHVAMLSDEIVRAIGTTRCMRGFLGAFYLDVDSLDADLRDWRTATGCEPM